MKKRILFVDDEPLVLAALSNRLRPQRHKWDMVFVPSGEEALEALARAPADVIVTDMRMPGMDGPTLLHRVCEDYPGVARIVLSGHAEKGAVLRAMATAHQFLPKPSDAGLLELAIERVCAVQSLINEPGIREVLGRVNALPAQPVIYLQLTRSLGEDDCSPHSVAQLLKQDSSLCATVLRIVNSAYFGLTHPVVTVDDAVLYLGVNTIRQLVLVAELFQPVDAREDSTSRLARQAHERHALLVAGIAAGMYSRVEDREAAFVAGLLHDVGKVLLLTKLPDRMRQLELERAEGEPMVEAERRLFGVTHAELGAYLLGRWQVPFTVVEAVARHHAPERVEARTPLGLVDAIHIADALANEHSPPQGTRGPLPGSTTLEADYLTRLDVAAELAEWRALAARLAHVDRGPAP